MITKFGKRFLTEYIAGNVSFINKEIAIGIANNTEYPLSDSNSRLGFEFYRLPVKFGGIDIDATETPVKYTAIYTATLPPNIAGKINEMGIYPGSRSSKNYFDNKFITDFELPYEWDPNPTIDQDNYRVGDSSLIFTSNSGSSKEYKTTVDSFDLSGYSNLDTLSFSYKVNNLNLSSILVRFYSTDNDYYQMQFTNNSTGYHIIDKELSNLTMVGSPNKSNINQIGITIVPTSGQASVIMDGLRINDEDTFDPTFGLISRVILPTEIEKESGRELLIEYHLDLSFGG